MNFLKVLLTIFLFCCFLSCSDTINEPMETAQLNIIVTTSDSVQVDYDNTTLVKKKLKYIEFFAMSWSTKIEPTEVGLHQITFTDFDDSIKASWQFYVKDTLYVYISNYRQSKAVSFFVSHKYYGE